MKKFLNDISLALCLVLLSLLIYGIHYLTFRDIHHIGIYFMGDLAFLGVEALIAYFLIDRWLNLREKKLVRKKLNMLAGIFFHELGVEVINLISHLLRETASLEQNFCIQPEWKPKQFHTAKQHIERETVQLHYAVPQVEQLAALLKNKTGLIVRYAENPSIHEHGIFSDTMMALFHLTEELLRRPTLRDNEPADQQHLLNDMKRVFVLFCQLWLEYMQHLKDHYPYLYLYNLKNRQLSFARDVS